jgi:hypothetical protein
MHRDWRVLALYRHGGVYADIDVECLRPLDELLEAVGHDDWDVLLPADHPIHERIHFGGQKMWMNDFMIAKPVARFLKRVIEAFVAQGGEVRPNRCGVGNWTMTFNEADQGGGRASGGGGDGDSVAVGASAAGHVE